MKKIIATMLTLVLLALLCAVPAGAETALHENLETLLKEYLGEAVTAVCKEVEVIEVKEFEGVTVFTAYCQFENDSIDSSQADDTIFNSRFFLDNYLIYTYNSRIKKGCPLFVLADGEVSTFSEAFSQDLVTIEMLDEFEGVQYQRTSNTVNGDGKFEAVFVERLHLHYADSYDDYYFYEELYFHYGDSGSADEAEPDFAVVKAHASVVLPREQRANVGKWVFYEGSYFVPEALPYFVYVPKEDKIYRVEEALDSGIKDIDEAFRNIKNCALRGDVDGNYVLNVKDATEIQKHLAGLESAVTSTEINSTLMGMVTDFDCSSEFTGVDIKDATAIQKHIAGLEV